MKKNSESKYVHICTVSYNRIEYTKECIKALFSIDAGYPYLLTIVDNNSQDGTRDFLNEIKDHEKIKEIVLLDKNKGVSYGQNLGWYRGPKDYYIKLDNDMVVTKENWLKDMIEACDKIEQGGVFGYNVEQTSYPLSFIGGVRVRVKLSGNLGGACFLIPERTFKRFGYWYQFDDNTYSEEDSEMSYRIHCAKLLNIYMEDEQIFIHLPGGRADMPGEEPEYREFKDKQRRLNMLSNSMYNRRMIEINNGINGFIDFKP